MKNFFIIWLLGIIIILVISLTSCSTQKKCNRHINQLTKLGCLKADSDTSYKEKTLKGDSLNLDLPIIHDTLSIDSVLREIKDTCISKETIKEIIKKIPCNVEPYYKDDSLSTLSIKVVNNRLKVNLIIKPRTYKEATINNKQTAIKTEKYIPNSYLVALVSVSLLLLFFMGLAIFRK